MSLPPGFLEELRNRLPLARVVGRKVLWDARKSNQAKGDFWAPCPFHQEKSASFHVDDRKGFYYCFGCHEKGDAISFVTRTENVSFIEAVEILAREAGMPMPAQDPRAAEKVSRNTRLAEVMEMAVQHYRLQLGTKGADGARAYLARRGLSESAQKRWEIGWAGDDRHGMAKALKAKGVTDDLLLEAGLTGEGQGGTYDRFWGRIIFPIRDARGRAIALGGRSLDPNARAKYLNSPQTPLFDKGRNLFNHGPAREAAGKGAQLIVAEGYMDVIALVEAGFKGVVAPLGTAITEDQLGLLWRIADEPVLALDGDAAGVRAAMRVIDLALPRLEAGKGLRFALLPGGQDPDELIKAKGAAAMQAVLDAAQPMVRLLWQRETEGKVFDSPERKAALDKALRAAIATIRDPSIRGHYGEEIKRLRQELWGQAARPFRPYERRLGRDGRDARGRMGPVVATPSAKASPLAAAGDGVRNILWDVLLAGAPGASPDDELRRNVFAILLVTPALIPDFAQDIEGMDCPDPGHAALRDGLLRHAGAPDLRAALAREIGGDGVESLLRAAHILAIRPPGETEAARLDLAEALAKLAARRGYIDAVREGEDDITGGQADEWLTRRLGQAAAEVDATRRKEAEDTREVVVAPNGLSLDKDEKERSAQVFSGIDFSRGGRGGRA
ncbi:DNA primase [Rubellimicrobium aerolatum]|uniref:DNA primase n=1 Tax=Rubellimicrobium aerolatum TaxID=490979 RepID=A0ABW0SAW0_9RHOB|nr:DNA primase [Rubellimicrobium aerolatum]MBP1805349.1 DNA primase [Rubellimicrobium aerolatum]